MIMKLVHILAFSAMMASPALAQTPQADVATAPAIERNAAIVTSDGEFIGSVDKVVRDKAGAVIGVKVVYKSRIITIPASTLTAGKDELTTSLSQADLRKL